MRFKCGCEMEKVRGGVVVKRVCRRHENNYIWLAIGLESARSQPAGQSA